MQEGQFRFAGVDDHYFMIAVVNPGKARLEYRAAGAFLVRPTRNGS